MPTRREILRKLDELEPKVAAAFREAIQNIRSNANITALARALENADLDAAIRAARVNAAAYTPLTEAVRNVYVQSGMFWASDAPNRIGFGFDVNNPRAANWIQERGAELVKIMREENADIIRGAIQDTVSAGIEAGQNPKKMALDIAGRIDKQTGRRVGGRIALTNQQSQWVRNAAQELRSGNKTMMNNYLNRKARDRRFDGRVRKAMKAGKGLKEADVARLTGRYSDRLLQHRAEMIARTETSRAFSKAQDESLRQLVEEGHAREGDIRRIWDATMDLKTRPAHAAANGQAVGLNEPFEVGGELLRYPLDPRASAANSVACRCFLRQQINYLTEEAARG